MNVNEMISGAENQFFKRAYKEEFMSNRVLNRIGARELTRDEMNKVKGAGTPCQITFSHLHGGGTDEDTQCDPTGA
jgi:hypothetical protein